MELPSSRSDAIKQGSSKYMTGKQCKNGHTSARDTLGAFCFECRKMYLDKHMAKSKEEFNRNKVKGNV